MSDLNNSKQVNTLLFTGLILNYPLTYVKMYSCFAELLWSVANHLVPDLQGHL